MKIVANVLIVRVLFCVVDCWRGWFWAYLPILLNAGELKIHLGEPQIGGSTGNEGVS